MALQYPPIFHRLRKSRLVDPDTLSGVYEELVERLRGLGLLPAEETAEPEQKESFDETDFELGDGFGAVGSESDDAKSDESDLPDTGDEETDDTASGESGSPVLDELERMLPAELELRGLLNHWQVTQLLQSRTRFYLGQYRIVDSLGAGGYGQVFLGRTDLDPSNKSRKDSVNKRFTDVAIKVLPLKGTNPKTIQKFRREIDINTEISHKNIVYFVESAVDGNVHYAVYEYMDGGDARQFVNHTVSVDIRAIVTVISETAKALWYLHEKEIVHRDVKPGNILLSRQGDVKLADLGLAIPIHTKIDQEIDEATNQPKRKIEGTCDYLSPDQILHPFEPSPKWDVYSLGCTFYYLVTGIVPFPSGSSSQKLHAHLKSDAPDPRMFNQQLPVELAQLIREMMDKNPENRPACDNRLLKRLRPWILSKSELAEHIDRLSKIKDFQHRPKAVQPVSLDVILESATAFNLKEQESLPPVPVQQKQTAYSEIQSIKQEEEANDFRDKLISTLAWFVILPLSIIGLALFIWILLRF